MSAARNLVLVTVLVLLALPAYAVDYSFIPSQQIRVDTLGTLFKIPILLSHNEVATQTFTIDKSEVLPGTWTASICVNDFCYAPFVNSIDVDVDPGVVDTVKAWIQSSNNEGSGHATLTCTPLALQGTSTAFTLSAISTGVDVLLIDDGQGNGSFYTDAFPAGKAYGTWYLADQTPTEADLANFPFVILADGEGMVSFGDLLAYTPYLQANGKLMVSGQNFAYNFCDPGSPDYSAGACEWLADNLHVAYDADNAASTDLTGASGDPIGDGLSLSISGGSGAGNQTSPDGVQAASGGISFLSYDATSYSGGVRNPLGQPRTVFLSFGFEGIADSGGRDLLMQRIFDYMDASQVGVDPAFDTPGSPLLAQARPNPFRPSTQLAIRLPSSGRARLAVYDAQGRLIRTLLDERLPAGETLASWDGRDERGAAAASGVYFARLETDKGVQTTKLSLLR